MHMKYRVESGSTLQPVIKIIPPTNTYYLCAIKCHIYFHHIINEVNWELQRNWFRHSFYESLLTRHSSPILLYRIFLEDLSSHI